MSIQTSADRYLQNEYTFGMPWVEWPDVQYIDAVNQQYRDAGIVVPFSTLDSLLPPRTSIIP